MHLKRSQDSRSSGTNGRWTRLQARESTPKAPYALPFGFVFLKRKKQFERQEDHILLPQLHQGPAQSSCKLTIRLVWPEALGLATTPQSRAHLSQINDD